MPEALRVSCPHCGQTYEPPRGLLTFEPSTRQAFGPGGSRFFTAREFEILQLLSDAGPTGMSQHLLTSRLFGNWSGANEASIRSMVSALRTKIKKMGVTIPPRHGVSPFRLEIDNRLKVIV